MEVLEKGMAYEITLIIALPKEEPSNMCHICLSIVFATAF